MSTPTYRGRTYEDIAGTIDHSLLRPELTLAAVESGCAVAQAYGVASVCCRPADVALVAKLLGGSTVAVGTVVGFPHGSSSTGSKVFETREAVGSGATEIDMVINIGLARSGERDRVEDEIRQVVAAARASDAATIVKVILENAYLNDEEKTLVCELAERAGADYVKTSTGFAPSGATIDDLKLMRSSTSSSVHVKAAGGVRTLDALIDVMDVGVTRVGATATAVILDDFRARAA